MGIKYFEQGQSSEFLELSDPSLTIEPIWEYRADDYWDNFAGNEEEMPLCYTETTNTLVDTTVTPSFTKYAIGSRLIYFKNPLT